MQSDIIELVLTGLLGLLVWMIKGFGAKMLASVDDMRDAIDRMCTAQKVDAVDEKHHRQETARNLRKLLDLHQGAHNLCRYSDVEADVVVRGAKAVLRQNGGGK